jgi:hypothetical protein
MCINSYANYYYQTREHASKSSIYPVSSKVPPRAKVVVDKSFPPPGHAT